MRAKLQLIVIIAVTGLALAATAVAAGRAVTTSDRWATHPAVVPFGAESSQLPPLLYLVRARAELPDQPGLTIHARRNDTFLVSAPMDVLDGLARTGCAVFPLSTDPIPEAPRRHWNAVEEPEPHIAAMVDGVTWPRVLGIVEWLTGFGTRYSYADNHRKVTEAIAGRFADIGLEPVIREYSFFGDTLCNVEATLAGTVHPDSYYVICGHFDSISEDPMNYAPGADDNATGIAAVMAAANILSRHNFEYSIRFICFSGEEQFLLGSTACPIWARENDLDIMGVMNYDMVGWWQPGVMRDLEIETNVASQWLAEAIVNAAELYTDTPYKLHVYDGAWWGDHASFWFQGYPAVNHEESWDWYDPDFNPYYHTIQDISGNLHPEFTTDNVKLAVASLATLAGYVPPLAVTFDLRPGTGANPFNPASRGVVPAMVVGAADLDVHDIEVSSLRLEGARPLSARMGDETGDGVDDLRMKFSAADLAAAIGTVTRGTPVAVRLTGTLVDGTTIEGEDALMIVGNAGHTQASGGAAQAPAVTGLGPAVPNPLNPVTRITYTLARRCVVRLTVYDTRGRLVERIVDGVQPAGSNDVVWNAGGRPSGVYFYRLEADGVAETRKLVLIK